VGSEAPGRIFQWAIGAIGFVGGADGDMVLVVFLWRDGLAAEQGLFGNIGFEVF
jgi:hypothetical protein